ncbi:Uncharacterised protein [Citrobacter amalonaticus]|nr:Uncharacterised protein [Citrobacter amalonaticus]
MMTPDCTGAHTGSLCASKSCNNIMKRNQQMTPMPAHVALIEPVDLLLAGTMMLVFIILLLLAC